MDIIAWVSWLGAAVLSAIVVGTVFKCRQLKDQLDRSRKMYYNAYITGRRLSKNVRELNKDKLRLKKIVDQYTDDKTDTLLIKYRGRVYRITKHIVAISHDEQETVTIEGTITNLY